jgi:hypothetical protein
MRAAKTCRVSFRIADNSGVSAQNAAYQELGIPQPTKPARFAVQGEVVN